MNIGTRDVCDGGRAHRTWPRGAAGSQGTPDDQHGFARRMHLGRRLARVFSPGRGADDPSRRGVVRVFLCDDVGDVRLLTRVGLEEGGGLQVVGEADTGADALAGIAKTDPDVVLVDLSMPGMDGFELIPKIRETAPNVGILVFSGFGPGSMEDRALEVGADGYLQKGESFERLREVTRDVARRRPSDRDEDEA
jgi:CheY-like chemotaxis protein